MGTIIKTALTYLAWFVLGVVIAAGARIGWEYAGRFVSWNDVRAERSAEKRAAKKAEKKDKAEQQTEQA